MSRCTTTIKAQCYSTLVRPTLVSASSIWSSSKKTASTRLRQYNVEPPGFPQENTSAQSVSQSCYSNFSGRHYRADECPPRQWWYNRIVQNLVDIPAEHHLNRTTLRTRGHSLRFLVPHTRTTVYRTSCLYPLVFLPPRLLICLAVKYFGFERGTWSGADPGGRTLKLEKIWFIWRKIVIFHTKYPKYFRTFLIFPTSHTPLEPSTGKCGRISHPRQLQGSAV